MLVAHSYQTLCHPMDCSPPGSPIHGIFQARILQWVAILFSRQPSWPRDWMQVSCISGRFFTFEPPCYYSPDFTSDVPVYSLMTNIICLHLHLCLSLDVCVSLCLCMLLGGLPYKHISITSRTVLNVCASLYSALQMLHFSQGEGLWQPWPGKALSVRH